MGTFSSYCCVKMRATPRHFCPDPDQISVVQVLILSVFPGIILVTMLSTSNLRFPRRSRTGTANCLACLSITGKPAKSLPNCST